MQKVVFWVSSVSGGEDLGIAYVLPNRYFFLCRHSVASSFLLFNDDIFGRQMMKYFSLMHRLHFLELGEYGVHWDSIFHFSVYVLLLSFRFQMCWLSLVEFLLLLLLNEALCWVNLVLNVFSDSPTYVSSFPVLVLVTIAW